MAINKDRIVKIINGRAVPANQPLPPAMPGYDTDYKGYAYDPDKAKALLAEAGFADGFDDRALRHEHRSRTRASPRRSSRTSRRSASRRRSSRWPRPNVIAAGGAEQAAPMIWSGGMAWIADFPDPSDFYGPILGCAGAVQGGWNWSWYCNKDLDAEAARGRRDGRPGGAAGARSRPGSGIFIEIMDDAPWAPVFNEQRYTIMSGGGDRIGGAGCDSFVDPVHIPDQLRRRSYATDAQIDP